MSDNLKVAKECGAVELGDQSYFDGEKWIEDPRLVLTGNALAAYTSRILASQQAAHDAEIASLKAELTASDAALRESRANDMESMKQLSAANAACAMNVEALRDISRGQLQVPDFEKYAVRVASDAISASRQQVSEWEAKKLEPLQRQVAMLHETLLGIAMDVDACTKTDWNAVLAHTQATAEAYDREHAAKVLEEAARDRRIRFIAACNLRTMAEELRAANKKENDK